MGQHHRHPRVDLPHRGQQVELLGGHVDVGAVEALGLLGIRQSEEDHGDVGVSGVLHRLIAQCDGLLGVRPGTIGDEAAGVGHRRGQARLDLLQRHVDAGRVDVGRSAALVAGHLGEGADDGDRAGHPVRVDR